MVLNKFTGSTKMDGTEQSLFKIVGTTMKHFAAYVYLKALQAGESIRLRVYNKVDDVSHWKFDGDATDSVSTNNGTVTNISSFVSQWKFDGNVLDSVGSNNGTITYNTNLKRLYKFESNLNDSTTAAANGTLAAGTATYVTGKEGNAFSFDNNTYITASDTGLQTVNGAWSFCMWLYPTDKSVAHSIYGWGTNVANQAIAATYQANGTIYLDQASAAFITSVSPLPLNTWTHVVATYDGTTAKLYINGVLDVTATPAAFNITLSGASGQKIGTHVNLSSKFQGNMDELRNYNIALSQAQVSALYMNGKFAQSHTFDGGEIISLGNPSNLQFERTNTFSISCWYKGTQSGVNEGIISKMTTFPSTSGYFFGVNNTTPIFDLINTPSTNEIRIISSKVVDDGNWHHLVVTYSGNSLASGVNFYIDGVLDVSPSVQINTLSASILNSVNAVIGSDGGNNVRLFGQLDEVRIYNSVLTASQVLGLYNYTGSNYVTPLPVGNALSLDGSSYVTVNNQTPYNFNNTNAFSISCWVKSTTSGEMGIVTKGGGGAIGYDIHWLNGQIVFRLWDGSDHAIYTGTTYNDGLWHNIVCTYTGSGNQSGMKTYVDGTLIVTGTSSVINAITNSTNIIFGAYPSFGNKMTGLIDEVQIWNYVLSSAEINAINAGRFANTHPIGLWHFDGDLYDYSGQGSTGSPTGTMTYVTGALSGSYNVPNTHFNFDGSEYIVIGNPTNLQFEYIQPFSIAFWLRTPVAGSSLTPIIGNGTNFDQKGIEVYEQLSVIIVRLINTSSSNEISVNNSTGTSCNDNLFHHYVITYDGTSKAAGVKIYQDGILLSNTVNTDNLTKSILSGNNWNIGSFSGGVSPTTAELDDFRIYNRALSSAEVSDLYTYPDSAMKQLVYDKTYTGTVSDGKYIPMLQGNQYMVTAQQTGGTNRIISWEREEVS